MYTESFVVLYISGTQYGPFAGLQCAENPAWKYRHALSITTTGKAFCPCLVVVGLSVMGLELTGHAALPMSLQPSASGSSHHHPGLA